MFQSNWLQNIEPLWEDSQRWISQQEQESQLSARNTESAKNTERLLSEQESQFAAQLTAQLAAFTRKYRDSSESNSNDSILIDLRGDETINADLL